VTLDYDEIKERTRRLWSLGDYPEIARLLEPAARELVDACAVSAGQEVLDVAAGSGNLAIAAAREGAAVVASDLTPAMIELGRARSEAEGLDIEWIVADAEALPFEGDRFDCVASVFGAMFAPRPDVVARELFRVVRPGNTVGMVNWASGSFPARLFDVHARYVPRPDGMPNASEEWGDEDRVRERFAGLAGTVELERRALRWVFESPDALIAHFDNYGGPNIATRKAVGEDGYRDLRADAVALVEEMGTPEGDGITLEAEYLLVVARKRG
jgi:SAM-dependent methyltransferase